METGSDCRRKLWDSVFISSAPSWVLYVSDPEVNDIEDVRTGEVADHEQCQSDVDVSPPFKSEATCQ